MNFSRVARFAVFLLPACASHVTIPTGKEQTAKVSAAATVAPITPIPCWYNDPSFGGDGLYYSAWDGTIPELYFADAYAECEANMPQLWDDSIYDFYGQSVQQHMIEAISDIPFTSATYPPTLSQQWIQIRSQGGNSCDRTTMQPTGNGVSITPRYLIGENLGYSYSWDGITPFSPPPGLSAQGDIAEASLNLCIAQRLRASEPGSAGGEALLLSDSDQREVLEAVRERSQIAMLQYALLGEAFSRPNPATTLTPAVIANGATGATANYARTQQRLPALEYFAWLSGNTSSLVSMGQDFSTAIQLHSFVTEELDSLLARSRSSHAPRTSQPLSTGDDLWGQGSWFQREMALMFGGDPLTIGPGGAWMSPESDPSPEFSFWFSSLNPGAYNVLDNPSFPPFEQGPYFHTSIATPQVMDLLRLARSFDDVWLQPKSGGNACSPYDVTATGNWIYGNVELDLENQDCAPQSKVGGNCPTAPRTAPKTPRSLTGAVLDDPTYPWRLWTKYRIKPDDAQTLAAYLNDALAYRTTDPSCPTTSIMPQLTGALQIGGVDKTGTSFSVSGGTAHLLPGATLNPRPVGQIASVYSNDATGRFRSPTEMTDTMDSAQFGFQGGFCPAGSASSCTIPDFRSEEVKRTMGATAAVAATREMLLNTVSYLQAGGTANTGLLNTYFLQKDAMLGVLTADIGPSVSVIPDVSPATATSSGMNNMMTLLPNTVNASVGYWDVIVTADPADSWWAPASCTTSSTTYAVYAVTGPYSGDLSSHPEATIVTTSGGTQTFASITASAKTAGFWTNACTSVATPPTASLNRFQFKIAVPSQTPFTLVVTRSGSTTDPRILAANMAVDNPFSNAARTEGIYPTSSGQFGVDVSNHAMPSTANPVQPAFDGFGIRNPWVPPFNAALLGGAAGDTSVTEYMSLAGTAADQASSAVETAMNDLQQQASDNASEQAAAVRAAQSVQDDRDGMCGIGNTACDMTLNPQTIPTALYPTIPVPGTCPGSCGASDQACITTCQVGQQLDTMAQTVIKSLTGATFPISNAVYPTLTQASPPAFTNYAGGTLQSAFISQWQAIVAPKDKISAVLATINAAKQQVAAAQAILKNQQDEAHYACSAKAMALAVAAGVSAGGGFPSLFSASYSPGPLIAQQDKCRSLQGQLGSDEAKATSSTMDAFASVSSSLTGFTDAAATIAKSAADVYGILTTAKLADGRAKLEAQLTQLTLTTSSNIYRIYRSDDVWRAKALLDGARRYALAARRAIEARYVVDLSTMSNPEPFVASPSLWSDQIYTYDLNMPAAVGLDVGQGSTGTVYTNQVKDYVSNLQAFLAGYAVQRPAAVASNELDIVNLPGLVPGTAVTTSSPSGDGGVDAAADAGDAGTPVVDYTGEGEWSIHCPSTANNPGWGAAPITSGTGSVSTACIFGVSPNFTYSSPDEIRLAFTLDPWGRINDGISSPPFVDRFNARWGNLAVNFVGTGIKDCTKAADPQGCYASSFVAYNLTQYGPSWVTDYDENWRLLNTPSMIIEGAKGLAAEVWLDPLQDGWSNPLISPILRTEFTLAPLGGGYVLDFQVPPEVQLNRIQRVQLLVGSTAWVKEQQ